MTTEYELLCEPGTQWARLVVDGRLWARLWLGGGIDTAAGADETAMAAEPVVRLIEGCTRMTVELASSVWERKRLVVECRRDRLTAWLEVRGSGRITNLTLFGGILSGPGGSGRVYSRALFRSVFGPAPSMNQRWVRPASESQALSVGGSPLPGQSDWFFTPPPTCYAVSMAPAPAEAMTIPDGPWLGLAVSARPGQYNFTDFDYLGDDGAFALGLRYGGQVQVDGEFISPQVTLRFGHRTPYDALAAYGREYAAPDRVMPEWWDWPMFCGWGAQQVTSLERGGSIQQEATQANYDDYLASLRAARLWPGTVVIDDKWQLTYGENAADPAKWPDLRGWIRQRQAGGQRVLLWLKLWDPEGLPPEECMLSHADAPVAVDPGNPAYERRLRRSVRRMLAVDGYGADGFKLDFSGHIPMAGSVRREGEAWGIELQRQLLEIIYTEAKKVRPDALIIAHTPHPYLADVVDMIRLNDVVIEQPVVPQMRHRAAVVQAVLPQLPIDADNWPMPHLDGWRAYMAAAADLGVPALYFAVGTSLTEPFTAQDYELIRWAWHRRDQQTA